MGHTYKTLVGVQLSQRSLENNGKTAASVLPAVGASSNAFFPARMGAIAASCRGLSDRHPRLLTI
jgi:hypothetical protein